MTDIAAIPVNLGGICGMSVPCGLDSKQLPIGLQLIGAPFAEPTLLRAGQEFMNAAQFDTKKMTYWEN